MMKLANTDKCCIIQIKQTHQKKVTTISITGHILYVFLWYVAQHFYFNKKNKTVFQHFVLEQDTN